MNNTPKLVYVTQIRTTPSKLWEALTDPDFIQQYFFGSRHTSTWKVGDPIECRDAEGELKFKGIILKSAPEEELSYSFDHDLNEPPSTVRFKIERPDQVATLENDQVQLTIIHEGFPEVSATRDRVQNGWPSIIKGIKSLLETGFTEPVSPSCSKEPA